jgi:hypothetical protein
MQDRTAWHSVALSVVTVASAVPLFGCSAPNPGGSSSDSPVVSTRIAPETPPSTTSAATVSGVEPTGSGLAAASVTVDASQYGRADVVTATVANNGQRAIFADDMKTDCSIVMLQRRDGQNWTGYTTCAMERAPQTVALLPGEHRRMALRLAEDVTGSGSFRVVFRFRLDRQPEGSEPELVTSPTFTVG